MESRIAATITRDSHELEDEGSALELDSHANSPVVGKYARILENTDRLVSVSGFSDAIGKPITLQVVNAPLAYDCEYSG